MLAAKERPEQKRALAEELVAARWLPLYMYARRRGLAPDRAEDAVQGLLVQLIEHDFIEKLDPARGRLRGYLKRALLHYLINLHEHEVAEKRGGGRTAVPIETAEALLASAPTDPAAAFDREWAIEVFESALAELEREFSSGERRGPVEVLKSVFRFEETPSYEDLARTHGMSMSQLKSFVHRGRKRFRELVLARVTDTVSTAEEAESELAELFRALEGT